MLNGSKLTWQVVSAIAIDPSGARIASGSHDYDTKLWDFGGMGARLKPFKSFEANGNYHVSSLDCALLLRMLKIRCTMFHIRQMVRVCWLCLERSTPKSLAVKAMERK